MTAILRIATDLGMDELRDLSSNHDFSVAVVGNTEQVAPTRGLTWRHVTRARLENMARACSGVRAFNEVRISDDAKVANAVFGSKGLKSRLNTWMVRSTEAGRIQTEIDALDFTHVDRVYATSVTAANFLKRRVPPETIIETLSPPRLSGVAISNQPVERLSWIGSANPDEGLQDFLRIAAQVDLPVEIVWTRTPAPTEFTSAVSSISMLGLEDRVEFGVPGTFEAFEQLGRTSSEVGRLWFLAARDYPARSGYELLVQLGARVMAFDSLYARNLAALYPGRIELVSEGDVLEAADSIEIARKAVA